VGIFSYWVSQAAVVVILVGQILAELRSSCFFSFLGVLAIPTTRDISVSYIGAVLQLGMLRLVPGNLILYRRPQVSQKRRRNHDEHVEEEREQLWKQKFGL
jgi:hypothetical protein